MQRPLNLVANGSDCSFTSDWSSNCGRGTSAERLRTSQRSKNTGRKANPKWTAVFAFTSLNHIPVLAASILSSLTSGAVAPVMSIFLGSIFRAYGEYASGQSDGDTFKSRISFNCISLAALGLCSMILNCCFFTCWLAFGELQASNCRMLLFDGLASRNCEFYDRINIQGALPRIQGRIRELQLSASQPLGTTLQKTSTAIFATGIALYYNWSVTLVTVAGLPLAALLFAFTSPRIQECVESHQLWLSKATASCVDVFSSITTVKCFQAAKIESERYVETIEQAGKRFLKQAHIDALETGIITFMTLAVFCQGFWYGSHFVLSSPTQNRAELTGNVIAAFWATLTATQALVQIAPQLMILTKGKIAGAQLRAIIATGRESTAGRCDHIPSQCNGNLCFEKVSFSYAQAPSARVLANFNHSFQTGQITFVVGKSGSGKTTLGQLLLRFYEPFSGRIFVDGVDISNVQLDWLRSNVFLVEQEPVLFNATIADNITLGCSADPELTTSNLNQAVDFALLRELINDHHHGLESNVESAGHNFSGGQRQRLALARARIRNSPIMVFDESTSALDPMSKSLIFSAIRAWRSGPKMTTLIITHDAEQVQPDDAVCIIEAGEIVASGVRSELEEDWESLTGRLGPQTTVHEHTGYDPSVEHFQEAKNTHDAAENLPATLEPDESIESIFALPVYHSPRFSRVLNIPLSHPNPITTPLSSMHIAARGINKTEHSSPLSEELDFLSWASCERDAIQPASSQDLELQILNTAGTTTLQDRQRRKSSQIAAFHSQRAKMACGMRDSSLANRQQSELVSLPSSPVSLMLILKSLWNSSTVKFRLAIISGSATATLHAAATPVFSYIFMNLLNTLFDASSNAKLALKWLLALLSVAIFDGTSSYCLYFLLDYSGQNWIDRLRGKALSRILSQPLAWFDESRNSPGALSQTLDKDAEEMRGFCRFAAYVYVAFLMSTMALIWSLVNCWRLTLVGIAVTPLCYATTKGFTWVSSRMEASSNAAALSAADILEEVYTKIKTVRALTAEAYFRKKYAKAVRNALRVGLKRAMYSGIAFGFSEAVLSLITALIFYCGAILTLSDECSVRHILLVFGLLLFSLANLGALLEFIPQIEAIKDASSRIMMLSDLPTNSHEDDGTTDLYTIKEVDFSNVSFSYPTRPRELAVYDLGMKIHSGITVAVGASGSGKSTLSALLLRLYKLPRSGRHKNSQIKINGRMIEQIATKDLRRLIALVPQSPHVFPLTVAQNISYGLPRDSPLASSSRVHKAARAAGIDEFIRSLPQGYDTIIGQGGVGLSGGQTQRLVIARALLRSPDVLILDEPTSALDASNAGLIRDTIRSLRKERPGMIVLIISHAVEMMKMADRIVMLERGTVVESGGSFEEMLARCGRFARFVGQGL